MGAIPPQVKKDRPGGNPGDQRQIQSLQKERINMNSVRPRERASEDCFASHFLHVYRHVDSENLACSPMAWRKASKTLVPSHTTCSPKMNACHGERSAVGKQSQGGAAA
jgi:hypothetical protein